MTRNCALIGSATVIEDAFQDNSRTDPRTSVRIINVSAAIVERG